MSTARGAAQRPPTLTAPLPLFVFGLARSGTTFAGYLLESHPQVRFSYEARLPRAGGATYRQYQRRLHRRASFDQMLSRLADAEGKSHSRQWIVRVLREQGDTLFERHQTNPGFTQLVESVYQLGGPDVRCWGNRFVRSEVCPQLLRYWPAAKVVVLLRDPRATYASQKRYFDLRLKYAAIDWNLHARWAQTCQTDPERYLLVRFEELMLHTAHELKRILQFIGLHDPALVSTIAARQQPRPAALLKWRRELSAAEVGAVESYCFKQMTALGYRPEVATRARRITPFGRAVETGLQYAEKLPRSPREWREKRIISRFLALTGIKHFSS